MYQGREVRHADKYRNMREFHNNEVGYVVLFTPLPQAGEG